MDLESTQPLRLAFEDEDEDEDGLDESGAWG